MILLLYHYKKLFVWNVTRKKTFDARLVSSQTGSHVRYEIEVTALHLKLVVSAQNKN